MCLALSLIKTKGKEREREREREREKGRGKTDSILNRDSAKIGRKGANSMCFEVF